jgi:hypothetical protein
MGKSSGFMGLDPEQARKVAKHLKNSGNEIQEYMKDIRGFFGGVQWTGEDMQQFAGDMDNMTRQVGGSAAEMIDHGHTVDRRVDIQEEASK